MLKKSSNIQAEQQSCAHKLRNKGGFRDLRVASCA